MSVVGEPGVPPSPYWADEDVRLYLGDCLEVLAAMEADSVDAVVTDPPAAVSFMGREWDSDRGGRDKWVRWLADRMEAAARVLKPGGHLLVWSLPRTSHWTAWALEDAGLEIRDCVLHLFGSGFPKSLDVSKAIDKRGGNDGAWFAEWLAEKRAESGLSRNEVSGNFPSKAGGITGKVWNWEHGHGIPTQEEFDRLCDLLGTPRMTVFDAEREVIAERRGVTSGFGPGDTRVPNPRPPRSAPATEDAARWEGFGTALKPGQEMWWLARKPLSAGTVAANVLQFGTGALNIAACRVEGPAGDGHWIRNGEMGTRGIYGQGGQAGEDFGSQNPAGGRWPANVVFTHSASCEMTGTRRVKGGNRPSQQETPREAGDWGFSGRAIQDYAAADGLEVVESWSCADDCPVAELDRQSGASTSRIGQPRQSAKPGHGYGMTHTGAEYADQGGASRFYPTFKYQAKAPASERPRLEDGAAHETVKPLGLISWLVRLITPPGGTVLDMFAGSGPVAEACIIEGFRCVLIEQDPKSAELIKTRLSKPIQPTLFGLEAS